MTRISLKTILVSLLSAALAVLSCNRPFELDLPLAVNSREIDLDNLTGSTHILVYADGTWNVKFSEAVEWASIDRLTGNGNSEIVLSYAANFGLPRRLAIAFSRNELVDTIVVNQAGAFSEPSLSWPCDSVVLSKDSGKVEFEIASNLYYSLQNVDCKVNYKAVKSDWISDVQFDGRKLSMAVSENAATEARRASVDCSVFIPGDSSTEDRTEVFTLNVRQEEQDAYLALATLDMQNGIKSSVSVDASNNVWAYADKVSFSVDYGSDASGEEWISGLSLSEKTLNFNLSDNMSGDIRNAVVKVSYDGKVLAELLVTQDVYPVVIPFSQLRGYATGTIATREFIEGYVVSENGSENICQNVQTAQFMYDFTTNAKSAVIESLDGKYGFMLKFDTAEDNTLQRYSKVRINLNGLTLSKQNDPESYEISGLKAENIVSADEPSIDAVPVKLMSVNELTDADIYTLVTLQNMEIVYKDGCYTNCTDGYSIKTDFNIAGTSTAPRWDVAPLLLTDKDGNTMSMLTNAMVSWRRDGTGVAQGSGLFTGIVVAEELLRYGDIGRYQIRPMVESDIALNDAAFSKTLVEWNWNNSVNDLKPEIGEGSISGVTGSLAQDYNAWIPNNVTTSRTDAIASGTGGKGAVNNQAAYFTATWQVGTTFDITFSTEGISGTNLQFGFVWGHGKQNNTTLNTPSHWKLYYSIDGGVTFNEFVPMVKNRSLVWWTTTSPDSAPGYTEHLFNMPKECFGQSSVIVRFEVADNVCDIDPKATASNWKTARGIEKGTFTSTSNPLRFGTITVRYN